MIESVTNATFQGTHYLMIWIFFDISIWIKHKVGKNAFEQQLGRKNYIMYIFLRYFLEKYSYYR